MCQQHQRSPKPVQMTPWPYPEEPWPRLHVDFGGPFNGQYFIVLVDTLSKWIEVMPVPSPSASATIDCLRTVYSLFGTHRSPDIMVSDNGPAFASALSFRFGTQWCSKDSNSTIPSGIKWRGGAGGTNR